MAHHCNNAVHDLVLVRTPRLPVSAGQYRLNIIRPGGPEQRCAPRDTAEQRKSAKAMRVHLGLRDNLRKNSTWSIPVVSEPYDDELAEWDNSKRLLSLALDDLDAWQDMGMQALKETCNGSAYRFLKSRSMFMFHSDRRPDDLTGAGSRIADKLQVTRREHSFVHC